MGSGTTPCSENLCYFLFTEEKAQSVRQMVSWIIRYAWKKLQNPVVVGLAALLASSWFIRTPYNWVGHLLKCGVIFPCVYFGSENKAVGPLIDLLEYGKREWRGETKEAEKMRQAYKAVYMDHHFKHIRRIRGDNYCALRATLFQILSQGIPFPTWMKEQDIAKFPEKVYSQGCNWVQQYSFGPEKYTGENVFGKLRKNLETLKVQWITISAIKDQEKRVEMCINLFNDQKKEYMMFEAMKFLMLYAVVGLFEELKDDQDVPNFCSFFFARDTSFDPLSFMLNHLNYVGDTGGLEQLEMFLLGFTLDLKISAFRLYKYGTEEFHPCYPEDHCRNWPEICIITEDDRHYNVPIA
uniref:OTU deubiquitinase with linear linkage specificity like n=1 Tax=Callorhinchus milii TaxID=7868 RepID=A0A4W3IMR8_CALMI